jgi:hypothetical protein
VVAAPVEPLSAEPASIASESSPAHAMELEIAAVVDAASPMERAPLAESTSFLESAAVESSSFVETAALEPASIDCTAEPVVADDASVDTTLSAEGSGHYSEPHGTWKPTMPPLPATPSVPWRRPTLPATTLPVTPSLVIDDADPDRAEREQEERATLREPHRVSFLPPILLDREDKSARQGGLTLAVIILLIAATLTLSYLMRRPSVSGDGVTMRELPASLA